MIVDGNLYTLVRPYWEHYERNLATILYSYTRVIPVQSPVNEAMV